MTGSRLKKATVVLITTILALQVLLMPVSLVLAETTPNGEVEAVDLQENNLLNSIGSTEPTDFVEPSTDEIQEFSFVTKTSKTIVNQPVIIRFTSKLAANQVLIRIPSNGEILESQFSNGESIQYSHGEYWTLSTKEEQTSFEIPILFKATGSYFLTIDHDADHFYIKVEDSTSEVATEQPTESKESETNDQSNEPQEIEQEDSQSEEMKEQSNESSNTKESHTDPAAIQPIVAVEENLSIPEDLIAAEDERILEETRDVQNRSTSYVRNWSQFRSAWNNPGTSIVILNENVVYDSSIWGDSINTRSSSIRIEGTDPSDGVQLTRVNFANSGYSLIMSGSANLSIVGVEIADGAGGALVRDRRTDPVVIHNGSGSIDAHNFLFYMGTGSAGAVVRGQNINLSGRILFYSGQIDGASVTVRGTGIQVLRGGTLTIKPTLFPRYLSSFISSTRNSGLKPILSDASSSIIIQTERLTMSRSVDSMTALPLTSWYRTDVVLGGVNGGTVISSNTDPNDFAQRYEATFSDPLYGALFFNGEGGDWIDPPGPPAQLKLNLHASPVAGGNPTATSVNLPSGGSTAISANPNVGYQFVRWEVVSGGAVLANATNPNTTVMIGAQDATIRAVYELSNQRLTLEASPLEGGNPTAANVNVPSGGSTAINANPNPGYRFLRWEIISGDARVTDITSPNTTITMGMQVARIRAVYESSEQNKQLLFLEASPVEGGNPTSSNVHVEASEIYANPNPGYRFLRWEIVSGNASIGNVLSPDTFVVILGANSEATVRAVYEKLPERLILEASPIEGGNPTSEIDNGPIENVYRIRANPNEGYRFLRWEVVSGDASINYPDWPETFVRVISETATVRAVYEQIKYELSLQASPEEGGNPTLGEASLPQGGTTTIQANPNEGYRFVQWEVLTGEATLRDDKDPDTIVTMGGQDATIQAVYEEERNTVSPVDPLDPEIEVDPENKPELPENQGLLSIDFVSRFNFGSQPISAKDQTYYAQTQRLLNEDGTVNEEEERPNYIQVSDRRSASERNGWQLGVTQEKQFIGEKSQELTGAQLRLMNQQLVTAQSGESPSLQVKNPLTLIPGNKRTLIRAEGSEGTGTWVYRFGDAQSADKSVALDVPKGANPEATKYSTTLTWELSAVPEN